MSPTDRTTTDRNYADPPGRRTQTYNLRDQRTDRPDQPTEPTPEHKESDTDEPTTD